METPNEELKSISDRTGEDVFASSDGLGSVKFPATVIVLTPTGKVPCCDKHAQQLRNLLSFMGAQTYYEPVGLDAECSNCVNEAKFPNR